MSAAVTMVSCSTPRSSLSSPSSLSPSPLMPCNISRLMRRLSSNDNVSSQASSHLCWTSPGVSHRSVKRTFIYILCLLDINANCRHLFRYTDGYPVVWSHSKSFHSPYVSPTEESRPNAEPSVSIDAGHSFRAI